MSKEIQKKTVLVADDSSIMRTLIVHVLKRLGYQTLTAENGEQCIQVIENNQVDVLLLDLNMPVKNGLEALSWIQENELAIPVIMITASEDINQAVQCIKLGAYEYLTKPVDNDRLEITLRNAITEYHLKLKVLLLEKELKQKDIFQNIYGKSTAIKKCIEEAMQVMETDVNVLINGESGTGKELFAQAIHNGSRRKKGPFVTINCAAISNELADSLLFGHVKGSFTGANSDHTGFFEQADGGTIFLDEIGDMNIDIQAKVLRALQEKKIRRVGEKKERPVNFRLISATHRDFSVAIRDNTFRADLYYRLEEYPLSIPPLRERREDIPLLAKHFLDDFCKANNIEPLEFSDSALSGMMAYHWPGNIRELQNVVRRAAISRSGNTLIELPARLLSVDSQSENLSAAVETPAVTRAARPQQHLPVEGLNESARLKDMELQAIVKAFTACGGNQSQAARMLGISRSTLIRKQKKYGLEKNVSFLPLPAQTSHP
jgi:DNA-binding NtrC family response regulator